MRLAAEQANIIKKAVHQIDMNAEVKLFGSRVDNTKRGGDIDLLIDSNNMGWREVAQLRAILERNLGEQKIDVVLKSRADPSFVELIEPGSILL